MFNIDDFIIGFDRVLRTLAGSTQSLRPCPGEELPHAELSDAERRLGAALMRVDHAGEICAQALYQGQAATARDSAAKAALEKAAQEETEHLAWTARRIEELGGHRSMLNPLWYAGSFAIGAAAGLLGDKWNLGFLAETERQVVDHLEGHLKRLPAQDLKSRAILQQMAEDEGRHATNAIKHGAAELPAPVKHAMQAASKVMTGTAFWI
ncbi:MAG: 2-polyprenyl-3-methyl-6-methoxy-1,4-benzoquinone monooxygenase [Betaproteobacteria bacterium]|nr:2-polyprenyl-3-methyl-6-methoxy-1,4-benzoquinone monooxygenase [Betaproteobacteria bacterium]MBI3935930.1 2-polyprenyl-3-methyl-6-methoxy-1,4-benzoquinone monooxygenase [Betaproteobacteria bacterium]